MCITKLTTLDGAVKTLMATWLLGLATVGEMKSYRNSPCIELSTERCIV